MKRGSKKTCINKKITNKKSFPAISLIFLALALSFSVSAKTTYINPAAEHNLSINNTIFIANAGNIGIGNTIPNVTLHVSGNANITGYLEVGKGLNVSNGMNVLSGSVGVGTAAPYNTLVVVGSVGVSGSINASSINTTGGAYFATASGNVGIGTTAPGEKLHVIGNANVSGEVKASNFTIVGQNGSLWQPVYGSDDDLVLYLPFNAPNGSKQYDRSPYGNDGVQTGTTCNATLGKYGAGCKLDGMSDYVKINNPSFIDDQQGTIEAWVKINDLTKAAIILSVNQGIAWGSGPDEYLLFYYRGDNNKVIQHGLNVDGAVSWYAVTPNNEITDNNWHYYTTTSDGSKVRFYLDGVEKTLTDSSGTNSGQWIGDAPDANAFSTGLIRDTISSFNGTIDEVRIYKRALSADEIRTHYLRGSGFGASGAITADKFRIVNTTGGRKLELNDSAFAVHTAGSERL